MGFQIIKDFFEKFNLSQEWLWFGLFFVLALILFRFVKTVAISRLKKISQKTKIKIDDVAIEAIEAVHWPFYVLISLYLALAAAGIDHDIRKWIYYIFITTTVYYVIRIAEKIIDFGVKKIIDKKKEEGEENVGIIQILNAVLKASLWVLAILLVLSNFGYNISSLIAGLGIGGVAVALALQNILGDIFSSLSIYFDKPFKVGDFITVGQYNGTVKKIGIKTTRIQALQGEEVVIPNNELTNSKVQNFGVMQKRRNVLEIGVTYDTPAEKLKMIPDLIKAAVTEQAEAEADRVHFREFGDFALIFEAVYFVNTGDYNVHMDVRQRVNLGILERFKKENIEMAFPTQTLYLKKDV